MVKEMGIVKYRRAFFGALSSHSSIDSVVNEEIYIKLFVILFVLVNVGKKFKNHLRLAGFDDDNAFVESLFKTAKYRPEFPARGFGTLEDARLWGTLS